MVSTTTGLYCYRIEAALVNMSVNGVMTVIYKIMFIKAGGTLASRPEFSNLD